MGGHSCDGCWTLADGGGAPEMRNVVNGSVHSASGEVIMKSLVRGLSISRHCVL